MTETGSDIAKLNDEFRRRGDGVTITSGIQEIPDLYGLLEEVRSYDRFDPDNDPYCEHDFGSLVWGGQKVFWKIDYYNARLDGWCDPQDPGCRRVLTVMLASEY
jgi:Protein of unknown function (DUF3768)